MCVCVCVEWMQTRTWLVAMKWWLPDTDFSNALFMLCRLLADCIVQDVETIKLGQEINRLFYELHGSRAVYAEAHLCTVELS